MWFGTYCPTVQFYIDTCLVPHMQKQGRLPPAPAHTKLVLLVEFLYILLLPCLDLTKNLTLRAERNEEGGGIFLLINYTYTTSIPRKILR